ncbi:hypothetical protein ABKN59_007212 [Abortiporus biennis]
MSSLKVWLITGASSGFSHHVLFKGDIAVGTLRNPSMLDSLKSQYPDSRLLILKLDVTIPADVINACLNAKKELMLFSTTRVIVSWKKKTEGAPENRLARALFEVP